MLEITLDTPQQRTKNITIKRAIGLVIMDGKIRIKIAEGEMDGDKFVPLDHTSVVLNSQPVLDAVQTLKTAAKNEIKSRIAGTPVDKEF